MTAEIAVLNRFGVALAADSAVTIGDGPDTKIFQSENKLFQLSEDHPIGIMLYNATVYFGIPWELIIKDFREKHRGLSVDKLFEIVPIFLEFLCKSYRPSDEQQARFLRRILYEKFSQIERKLANRTLGLLITKTKDKVAGRILHSFFVNLIDEEIEQAKGWDELDEMSLEDAQGVIDSHSQVFEDCLSTVYGALPITDAEKRKFRELAARLVKSSQTRNTTTGLVFAGYGRKELFPSLHCVEIQGFIDEKLIKTSLEKVDIDRAASTASVIPFAQKEAADSLLYGRSDIYEESIVSHFKDVMNQVGNALVDVSVRSIKKREELKRKVASTCKEALDRFSEKIAPEIKVNLSKDILDTIRHMPKQELASFAEALVSVTSIKRRISVGPETVGGPIDVAVISRHEGFVWVKRKLYFPAELNPRHALRMRRAHDVDKGKDAGRTGDNTAPP